MKQRLFSFLFLLFTFLASCSNQPHESHQTIQIKGSDTMVNLAQAWAEAFMQKNPEAFVAVTGGGSGTGIAALINGACDLAMCSRSMKEKEIAEARANGIEPHEFVAALDGIAVCVHPSNPKPEMTLAELRDLFMGTIRDWSAIGGAPGKVILLSREVNSGTHLFFKEQVLRLGNEKGAEEFSPDVLLMPSSQAIAEEAATNPNAIGYFGMGYISPRQKIVAVSKEKGAPYVLPSIETVQSGSYPISRPLYFYTNGEPAGPVKEFLDFILSPEGEEIVRQIDFVPRVEK